MAESLESLGETFGSTGKGALCIVVILSQIFKFSMNNLLGIIRSLSLITHMMLMQLIYAPTCVIFFGKILEFVTFDVIPTEDIYA